MSSPISEIVQEPDDELEMRNEAREREMPAVQEVDSKVEEEQVSLWSWTTLKQLKNFLITGHADELKNKKVHKEMSKHYKQIQAIEEQVKFSKSMEKDIKELKAELSEQEVLKKSLDAKLAERRSKVEQTEELWKQVEKECSIMREEGTNYLRSVKLGVESKKRTLETKLRNIEAVLSEVEVVYSKIISVKELASVKVEELDRQYEEILVEFHEFANSILRDIKSGPEATERGELRRQRFGMLVTHAFYTFVGVWVVVMAMLLTKQW